MVIIGQASIDENGSISGGQAGNQGTELNLSPWHDGGWTLLLRFRDPKQGRKAALICRQIVASKKVGYDQGQRNTLRKCLEAAKWDVSKMSTPCETDCSAFVAVCAEAAGVDMDKAYTAGNAPATFQMRAAYVATGAFEALADARYLRTDANLMDGDILVNEARHAVMVVSGGVPDSGTGDNPSAWAREATDWAKREGLFGGDGSGNYDWQQPITREAMAAVLYRFSRL